VFSQIVIIGEAASRLSAEFLAAQPHIPWRQIIGMRHRLIHGYDQVDWERVWAVVQNDVPSLLSNLEPLLPQPEDSDS